MNDVTIRVINQGDSHLDRVEKLFLDLYEYMKDTGLLMPLIEGGEVKWRSSIEKILGGRFGILLGAFQDGEVVGFAHGTIRYAPEYQGSLKVGFITNMFVIPEYRRKHVGKRLVAHLEEWFKEKGVHSYELQVLCDNETGITFWESTGFRRELLQMRKLLV